MNNPFSNLNFVKATILESGCSGLLTVERRNGNHSADAERNLLYTGSCPNIGELLNVRGLDFSRIFEGYNICLSTTAIGCNAIGSQLGKRQRMFIERVRPMLKRNQNIK